MVKAEKINLEDETFTGGLTVIVKIDNKNQKEGIIALENQPLSSFADCVLKQLRIEKDYKIIGFHREKSQMTIRLIPYLN